MDYQTASVIVIGTIGVGFLSFLCKWAWTHTHQRITDVAAYVGKAVDDLSKEISAKADNAELSRVRDAQIAIFDQIRQHNKEDTDRHTQILTQMGELKGMLGTLLSRKRD